MQTLQELVPKYHTNNDDGDSDDEAADDDEAANSDDKAADSDDKADSDKYTLHSILLGGDQLLSSIACHVIPDRMNSTDDIQPLKGLLPVVEDWHAKLCFLVVR